VNDNIFRIMTMSSPTLETSRPAEVDFPQPSPIFKGRALTATIIDLDCGVLVRIEGDAGVAGLEKLQFAFTRVIARRTLLAVLDLSRLTDFSSLAMGLLVRLSRDLGRWNGRVKIANCPPVIRVALEVARLTDFFQFHASVDEAVSNL
jgi:anti-anti-sigma factor